MKVYAAAAGVALGIFLPTPWALALVVVLLAVLVALEVLDKVFWRRW